jgi:hypothetical protein
VSTFFQAAGRGTLSVVSKTTTYTSTPSDEVILCSGSAFTLSLAAVTGNSGISHTITKTDSSLTNIITISGTGVSTTLNTAGESVRVVCDGSSWYIVDRCIPTNRASWTPTFTGFGTAATVTAYSWRHGPYLNLEVTWTNGTVSATEARVSMGFNGTDGNVTSVSTLPTLQVCGKGNGSGATTTDFGTFGVLIEASKTYVTFSAESSTGPGVGKSNGNAMATNSTVQSFFARVPINGWNG